MERGRGEVARGPLTPEAAASLGTAELVRATVERATALGRKELELARAELEADLAASKQGAAGVGTAAVFGICALALLLVAAALALATVMPGWLAALLVSAVSMIVSAAAGLRAKRKLPERPLEATRRTASEELRWAKELRS